MTIPVTQPKTPTRYPNGVGTRKAPDPLAMFPAPDPTDLHAYHNDFDTFTVTAWNMVLVGTGTTALVAGDGGVIAMTTTAASGDSVALQKIGEGFSFEYGRRMWFKARVKVDALTGIIALGLQTTNANPFTAPQGIFMLSSATGAITTTARYNASTGATSATAGQLVPNVWTDLAWYWNGKSEVDVYQDGKQITTILVDQLNNPFLPTTTATITLAVQTTTAAARVLTVDYVLAAKARR